MKSKLPDTGQTKFEDWFGESVTADCSGNPIVWHHSSEAKITKFRKFSHFGDLAAAKKRAEDRGCENPELHKVYLAIKEPLDCWDDEADNNTLLLLDLAKRNKLFTEDDVGELLAGVSIATGQATINARSTEEHTSLKWHAGMDILAPRLELRGYDGLRYQNRQEGGVSLVNFHTRQVWQLGKPNHN